MEYQVPQFIDVQDKIFGPFTLKQFIFLAGGIGVCVVIFLYLPLVIAIIVAAPIGAFTAALAFYRMNGKSFMDILESGFNYYTKGRLYLWKKDAPKQKNAAPVVIPEARQKLGLSDSRLKELAWSLDIKDQSPS